MTATPARWPTSNAEFLVGVFDPLPAASWPVLCGFAENPDDRSDNRADWTGHPWAAGCKTDDPALNWYFTLATYRHNGAGWVDRDKDRLAAIYGVLVDDIGTRAPLARLDSLPPSVLTMTSAGNFQALYLLDPPSTDRAAVHALQSSLIAAGLCDPGAHGPAARYARMPFASNRKHSPPQSCYLVEWHTERRYSIDAIMRGLNLSVVAPRTTLTLDVPDAGPCAEWRGPESDEALLEIAMRSRSAASAFGDGVSFAQLWEADAEALGRKWPAEGRAYDASSADMALAQHLAFFTGRDQTRIDRMMRASALARDKYERADYLPRTISAACAQQRDVYRGAEPAAVAGATSTPADPGRWGIIKEDPLNAARALLHRRYSHADGACLKAWQDGFYRWDASHWVEMTTPDARAQLYDFLDRDGSADYRPNQAKVSNLLDALKAAAHLDSAHVAPCWISGPATAPPFDLVPCANGLLHLPTRSMLPATPRFFNMNAVPFGYEPSAVHPAQWLHFLREVWPDDPEAISTLQELFGYLLTPDTSQQKIFLIIGPKRSGKGTIARVLTEMLGAANVASPSLASLAKDFGLQPLIGKQAAIISDARLGGQTDAKQVAENLLRVSGEDRVDVARKNTSSLSLRLGVRFVLLTNELPRIADASGAMASRFVILSMSQSFLGREDPGLTPKLLRELPGVLAWAVDGWHRLNARGHFVEPRSSAGAAQELADLGSPISAFVRDECQCSPHAEVETGKLFAAWRHWCAVQGMQHSGTQQTFGRDLRAAFPSISQTQHRSGGDRARFYRGVALTGTQWHAFHPIAAPAAPTHQ